MRANTCLIVSPDIVRVTFWVNSGKPFICTRWLILFKVAVVTLYECLIFELLNFLLHFLQIRWNSFYTNYFSIFCRRDIECPFLVHSFLFELCKVYGTIYIARAYTSRTNCIRITSKRNGLPSEILVGTLISESISYTPQRSIRLFPCLLLSKGWSKLQCRSPMHIKFWRLFIQ